MHRSAFEKLVEQAVAELPREFRDRLKNVVIIVDDNPSVELLEEMEIPPDETLLGLYEGEPLTERGFEAPLHPDRIWIFQEPIEDACTGVEQIKEEIKITIVHEVAHFFGIEDEHLEDLGYG